MKRYHLHVPADLQISPHLRNIAAHIFEELGFTGSTLEHLKLVFDEVLMNAVKYGSLPDSTIYVSIEFENQRLTVSFEDEGGENRISAEELKKIIAYQQQYNDPGKTSGRGLAQIATKLTDELKVCNSKYGGLCIMFRKALSDTPAILVQTQKAAQMEPKQEEPLPQKNLPENVFDLEGEIDDANLAEKTKAIESFVRAMNGPAELILDFEHVSFCTSSFLGKLAAWKINVEEKHGHLALRNLPDNIREILDLVGLTRIIPILEAEKKTSVKNS